MRPIPTKLRDEMTDDKFYKYCCLAGIEYCAGRVQWHHVWIYAGTQINEKWAIVPACERHHDQVQNEPTIKREFERISLMRATDEDLKKYPRKDWDRIKRNLI